MSASTEEVPQPAACGISEWLRPGNARGADRLFAELSVRPLPVRCVVTRDDWQSAGAAQWFRWLCDRIGEHAPLTVALYRTDPGRVGSAAPVWAEDPNAYRQFVADVRAELGDACSWIELSDPLGPPAWPDPSLQSRELLTGLADRAEGRLCLGGVPLDAAWLALAAQVSLPDCLDALALVPAAPVVEWGARLARIRSALPDRSQLPLWLTAEVPERHRDPRGRTEHALTMGVELARTGVDRLFLDQHRTFDGADRAHRGTLCAVDGAPSLTARTLATSGPPNGRPLSAAAATVVQSPAADAELVIGGAGFIGSNLAARLAQAGHRVIVLDNLSRPGTEFNIDWLLQAWPERIGFLLADIRDRDAVRHAVARARRVFHLAAQVAVTTSLAHPREDHVINATGTLNVLEVAREREHPPALVFTSTNKVYGGLADIALEKTARGYEPADEDMRAHGIGESRPLELRTPYACSKGAADQYVLDYARTFSVPAAVLRMSCIYGPRQFGNEDQGWVAHFARRVLRDEPITIYGDGDQLRDVLHVDDLVDAALAVADRLPDATGEAFNVGGGPDNWLTPNALLQQLSELHGDLPSVRFRDWRLGDQRYYASDTGKLHRLSGWTPQIDVRHGVGRLYDYLQQAPSATSSAVIGELDRTVIS